MKIIFEPAARIEFAEAVRWYAKQAGALQATDFRQEVYRALALLREHPLLGTPTQRNTRRMAVHDYPYFVIYRADDEALRVLALAHQSRRPAYWAGRR